MSFDIKNFMSLFKDKDYKQLYLNFKEYEDIILKDKNLLLNYYVSLFYLKKYVKCVEILENFKSMEINCFIVEQSFYLLSFITKNKKLVGTYNKDRIPQKDEIIINIGDYPIGYNSLIINNPIRLNYKYALDFEYDYFEGEKCWERIDKIFIINLPQRKDRLFDILREFKRVQIPLNKVEIIKAEKYPFGKNDENLSNYLRGSIGCSLSHLKVIKKIEKQGFKNCLIFEDDFTFSEDIFKIKSDITLFLNRKYDYNISFLSYSTEGEIKEYDDLLSQNNQRCTTASGYLISSEGVIKLIPIWEEGLELLIKTGNIEEYACDIFWKKLDKKFVFKDKIGYQRPSISQITGLCTYNLD